MYANYSQYGNTTSVKKEANTRTDTEPDGSVQVELFNIDGEDAFRQLLSMYKIVVVDVWADFCMPCKRITPIYQKLANKYSSDIISKNILFLKDRIDDNNIDSVHQGLVQAVPTFFIYAYGKLQGEIVGPDIGAIDRILNDVMDKSKNTTMLNEKDYQEQIFQKYQTEGVLKQNQQKNQIEGEYVGVL